MKIQAKQLNQDLQDGKRVNLIDVRTPVEQEEMHISGSVMMPLDQLDAAKVKSLGQGSDVSVLICRSGKRADQAAQKLMAEGCDKLAILEGGVLAWEKSGLPLERSENKRLPLMQQVQLVIGLCTLVGSVLALTVDVRFAFIPAIFGAGMTMAGSTGWCGLAMLLSKMPWNKVQCGGRDVKSCAI